MLLPMWHWLDFHVYLFKIWQWFDLGKENKNKKVERRQLSNSCDICHDIITMIVFLKNFKILNIAIVVLGLNLDLNKGPNLEIAQNSCGVFFKKKKKSNCTLN